MDDEVVHEDHEHRDDTQQFDAGIPPICDLGMHRRGVSDVCAVSVRVLNFLARDSLHSLWLVLSQGMLHCAGMTG